MEKQLNLLKDILISDQCPPDCPNIGRKPKTEGCGRDQCCVAAHKVIVELEKTIQINFKKG